MYQKYRLMRKMTWIVISTLFWIFLVKLKGNPDWMSFDVINIVSALQPGSRNLTVSLQSTRDQPGNLSQYNDDLRSIVETSAVRPGVAQKFLRKTHADILEVSCPLMHLDDYCIGNREIRFSFVNISSRNSKAKSIIYHLPNVSHRKRKIIFGSCVKDLNKRSIEC